jgi:hypothetical protein
LGTTKFVYDEVAVERLRQNDLWGGAEHDDLHGPRDWRFFICEHAERAGTIRDYRKQMIRVAALAIAAVESYDRKNRP